MAHRACRMARVHLSDRLDEQPLPLRVRAYLRFHFTVCPPCRRFARSLTATRDALGALRDADVVQGGQENPPADAPESTPGA
jgi:predicted anti-sigma-YlaC factor YlaD